MSTSVVLQLEGSNHVVGVLYISSGYDAVREGRGLTLEAFSMAVLLAEISAACPSTRAVKIALASANSAKSLETSSSISYCWKPAAARRASAEMTAVVPGS